MYSQLGAGVLNNAWQGYNSALFAYGQTGSGKSYSIVGFGANKGDLDQDPGVVVHLWTETCTVLFCRWDVDAPSLDSLTS